MRPRSTGAVFAGLLVLFVAPLAAQSSCTANPCSVPVTGTLTVGDVASLTLSTATTSLGAPTAATMGGTVDATGPTVTVQSNRAVRVQVTAAAATFTRNGAASTKPASDLKWGTSAGSFPNSVGVATDLLSTSTGTSGTSRTIYYRTSWLWAQDVPGTYKLDITFTLVAP